MQSLTLTEESVIKKKAARISLTVFTEELGYENADFHLEWYDKLVRDFSPLKHFPQATKRLIQLWPRGHGKTECTTINYVTWLIGNFPDIHINIVTKTASLAEEILTAIITRFESDERYKEIFGNLKPKQPKKWTNREIIVNRKEISKNPTLKATGLMGPITGGRSDLIICDDIIDEENVRTPLQMEKVSTWFNKILYPTLYPWGGIIVIGTRWHYADIYTELLETWKNQDVKKAIQKDGTALWPTYWSLEKLEERRNQIGSIYFNCQYQNDPTPMAGDKLKAEWLIPWEKPPTGQVDYYAGIDPSMGENDLFGIATVAVERRGGQVYLVDVWAEPTPMPEIFKTKIPLLQSQHKYGKVYFEKNFWQKLLLNIPQLKKLPVVPVTTVKDKMSRFIAMSAHFEAGRVLVNPLLLRRSEFWTEWVQFPRGQHDDALDAVELVVSKVIAKEASKPSWLLI